MRRRENKGGPVWSRKQALMFIRQVDEVLPLKYKATPRVFLINSKERIRANHRFSRCSDLFLYLLFAGSSVAS